MKSTNAFIKKYMQSLPCIRSYIYNCEQIKEIFEMFNGFLVFNKFRAELKITHIPCGNDKILKKIK